VHPLLRKDLIIAHTKNNGIEHIVIKDPIRGEYFRFDKEEWDIIELFKDEISEDDFMRKYEEKYEAKLDKETYQGYVKFLESKKLIVTSKKNFNMILVEKIRHERKTKILSKKGSVMYKRFPVIDPDSFLEKALPFIRFFWHPVFIALCVLFMIVSVVNVSMEIEIFKESVKTLLSFKDMSFSNIMTLWFMVYVVIAIHEFGHGFTCKYFGGEVHEIGLLLLFFQPCLYCNVNDAWLFDKKYKQVSVTLAGAYIEFLLGAIASWVWLGTDTGTLIHMLSFQIMIVCSASTVFMNLNPLMKLDGYYLLSDILGIPNLRQNSFDYLKYFVSRHLFFIKKDPHESTKKEKLIYLSYGIAGFFWLTGMMSGLFFLAEGFLVDAFGWFGLILSLYVIKFLFMGQIMQLRRFSMSFIMTHHQKIKSPYVIGSMILFLCLLGGSLFIKIPIYSKNNAEVVPYIIESIRLPLDGYVSLKKEENSIFMSFKNIEKEEELLKLEINLAQLENQRIQFAEAPFQKKEQLKEDLENIKIKILKIKEEMILEKIIDIKENEDIVFKDISLNESKYLKKGSEIFQIISKEKFK